MGVYLPIMAAGEGFRHALPRGLDWLPVETNTVREGLAVGAGAALGACARYVVALAVPAPELAAVFLVNAVGCAAMGYFAPGKFWGAGILGGFTSFSAVSLASAQASAVTALAVLAASVVVCVAAWLAGHALRPGGRP